MNTPQTSMRRCLELAIKGLGHVAPNPMVGCVIVHENKIIGEGYHKTFGDAHAEVNAVHSIKDSSLLKKSTLYVNLEPCSHQGKTPPCAGLVISSGIKYVVIGCLDPNPLVKGKGMEKLVRAGVDVKVGVLENDCRELNRRFITFHEKKRPYIILKWAQTKDGFIDKERNDQESPLQVSGPEFKKLVHSWRSQEQAILAGTNTVLKDNPRLTVRETKGRNPIRVILDRDLKIPAHFHVFGEEAGTLVFTEKTRNNAGVVQHEQIDFSGDIPAQLLHKLSERNILSVILEGGAMLLNSFLSNNLWDEARVFVSEESIGKGIKAPAFNIPSTASSLGIGSGEIFIVRNT